MSFVTVLKNDFRVFFKCFNYQLIHGAKIKNSSTCYKISCKTYSDISNPTLPKLLSEKTVLRLKQFDGVGKDFDLIYRVPRTFSYSLLHGCILICGFSLPALLFSVMYKNNFKFPLMLTDRIVIANLSQSLVAIGLTSSILTMMFILVTRFPFRLYLRKSTKEYIAAYPNFLLPWKMKQLKFREGDVTCLKDSKYAMFQLTNYKIKGFKSILREEHFTKPLDLEKMLDGKSRLME